MTTGFQQQTPSLGAYPTLRSTPKPQHVGQVAESREKAERPPEARSFQPAR